MKIPRYQNPLITPWDSSPLLQLSSSTECARLSVGAHAENEPQHRVRVDGGHADCGLDLLITCTYTLCIALCALFGQLPCRRKAGNGIHNATAIIRLASLLPACNWPSSHLNSTRIDIGHHSTSIANPSDSVPQRTCPTMKVCTSSGPSWHSHHTTRSRSSRLSRPNGCRIRNGSRSRRLRSPTTRSPMQRRCSRPNWARTASARSEGGSGGSGGSPTAQIGRAHV